MEERPFGKGDNAGHSRLHLIAFDLRIGGGGVGIFREGAFNIGRIADFAIRNSAADFKDHFTEAHAHWNFHQSGVLHAARQGEHFGSFTFLRANLRIHVPQFS